MEDVAKMAGVSVSTVSHVINRTRFVRKETRERVLEAMRVLDYYPNYAARSLRSQKSRLIGVLMPDITNPFYVRVVSGIEKVMRQNGYSIMVCNSDDDLELEQEQLKILKAQSIEGLIMRATPDDHAFLQEFADRYPIVFVDCKPNGYTYSDRVVVDNERISYEAVRLLIQKGHQRIGIITGIAGLSTSEERLAGYERALAEYGIPVEQELIKVSNSRVETGRDLMVELLELGVTAVCTGNNLLAMGAVRAIKDKGRRIPEDVAIIGFDDEDWCGITDPPLTVVNQPSAKIGEMAAELLLERISDKDRDFQEVCLNCKLVVRQSC